MEHAVFVGGNNRLFFCTALRCVALCGLHRIIPETQPLGQGVVHLKAKDHAGLYSIEQQHGHKGEGKRDETAAKKEIVKMQIIKEGVQCITKLTAACEGSS